MHTVRKNNQITWEVNVLVYAEDQDTLWEYRNMLNQIEEKSPCKICLTLTRSLETALSLSGFLQGGIDVYVSDCKTGNQDVEKFVRERIQQQHARCYCLKKEKKGYICSYLTGYKLQKIRYEKVTKKSLKKTILKILGEILELNERDRRKADGKKSR